MPFSLKFSILSLIITSLLACSDPTSNADHPIDSGVDAKITQASAPPKAGVVTYLGNEALMVEHVGKKILFDPFFHNTFNTYQAVPEDIRVALFNGQAPYDNIDAIFISHAHADHFSASDIALFLKKHTHSILIAPQQAIDSLGEVSPDIAERLHPIGLEYKDQPIQRTINGIRFDAVRIPHAGWPQRAEVSNLVFRVSLSDEVTVVHMGDADPNDEHFKPLMVHWESQKTDTAFPPYWFFMSETGKFILSDRIKADENVGVHVPVNAPNELIQTGALYFSQPGEIRNIN